MRYVEELYFCPRLRFQKKPIRLSVRTRLMLLLIPEQRRRRSHALLHALFVCLPRLVRCLKEIQFFAVAPSTTPRLPESSMQFASAESKAENARIPLWQM